MIEQPFELGTSLERTIQKVVQDDNVDYIYMRFNQGEGLPEHYSNSNVYMTVVEGVLSIALDDQDYHDYPARTLLKIPYHIKMNVQNHHDELLVLIVVKAPAPKNYPRE